MIDEPLSSRWRYDLGSRKIFELRSALGLAPEGPAPRGAVFAYAVVPALARLLTHPQVASKRDEVRLSRVEVAFASELDMRGELVCGIDTLVKDSIVGKVMCTDAHHARAVVAVHLEADGAPAPTSGLEPIAELALDPARCMAFAAATWDLNPAYWDREFADAADLGGPVAPPGLAVALTLDAIEQRWGSSVAAFDVGFRQAGRPGDAAVLRAASDDREVSFEVDVDDRVVIAGRAVLGATPDPL